MLPVPITEFTVPVGDHTLTCSLATPLHTTLDGGPGLLLTFSTTRDVSFQMDPYHLIVNAALALRNWHGSLVDKSVYLAIGNRDYRVDTRLCIQFALGLLETQDSATGNRPRVQFHVVDAEGHSIGDAWRIKGAEYLLPPKEG